MGLQLPVFFWRAEMEEPRPFCSPWGKVVPSEAPCEQPVPQPPGPPALLALLVQVMMEQATRQTRAGRGGGRKEGKDEGRCRAAPHLSACPLPGLSCLLPMAPAQPTVSPAGTTSRVPPACRTAPSTTFLTPTSHNPPPPPPLCLLQP